MNGTPVIATNMGEGAPDRAQIFTEPSQRAANRRRNGLGGVGYTKQHPLDRKKLRKAKKKSR